MRFYDFIMLYIFDSVVLSECNITIVDKGVSISPCGAGLGFYLTARAAAPSRLLAAADRCWLLGGAAPRYDVLRVLSRCHERLPRGATRTLLLIAPILNPYQRRGYCTFYVDSKSSTEHRNKREVVRIDFDTTVRSAEERLGLKACARPDQDPLERCAPVDCLSFYDGRKPYYHPRYKRCVEAPRCLRPDTFYHPVSNTCVDGSITDEDIELLKKEDKVRQAKDVLIIRNTFNDTDILDLHTNSGVEHKTRHNKSRAASSTNAKPQSDQLYIKMFINKCFVPRNFPVTILIFIILIQCCLIFGLAYNIAKNCSCLKEKKVVRKFFNYRQDATVTTPLIATSNMDTETEPHFLSDSSKVDQKIKCYKACHKEAASPRAALSDDILAKCLARRDWRHAAPPEVAQLDDKKDARVVFADERAASTSPAPLATRDKAVEANRSSEQEIKCLDYGSHEEARGTVELARAAVTRQPRCTLSLSTEKGAQASFSNDSIDEYLSERGVIYLAGDNVSRYTFSSSSVQNQPSGTCLTSITSKNVLQKVLSMIRKKSKAALSEPGGAGAGAGAAGAGGAPALELLHMSRGTGCSSSNDSQYNLYTKKHSRTSL